MSATETVAAVPDTANGPPLLKHLARRSELRFDGTVETLCGIIRQPSPHRATEKCPKCLDAARGITMLGLL